MSFVYWVFEDKDCFVFPHNAGYVGVSEDPKAPLVQHTCH